MREIKFRAWHNQLKVMIPIDHQYQLNIRDKNWEITDLRIGCKVMDNWRDNDKGNILMQFTGLLDKLGKEIYEGDIIEWEMVKYKYAIRAKVYFESSCPSYYVDLKGFPERLFSERMRFIHVIGNIYENPELLKD